MIEMYNILKSTKKMVKGCIDSEIKRHREKESLRGRDSRRETSRTGRENVAIGENAGGRQRSLFPKDALIP